MIERRFISTPALPLALLACVLAAGLVVSSTPRARAQEDLPTLVVTSAADPGDGLCDDTCSLRDALRAVIDLGQAARITFDLPLPPGAPGVIRLNAPLPFLEVAGTIVDGASQPGYQGRPLIHLDGARAPSASGLVATAAGVEVRALAAGNFERYGFAAIGEDADGVRFLGNWAGLAPNGRDPAPNRLSGIAVLAGARNALIGDACPNCGNHLAGNSTAERTGHGVLVGGRGSVAARIRANVIGLNVDGAALPNDDGILIVDGANATVGGRGPGQRNVISGNRVAGVEVRDTALLPLRIEANYIGVDARGFAAVPNDVGVFVHDGAADVVVGAPGAGNLISGNRVGVAVETRAGGIVVQSNLIGLDVFARRAVSNTEDGVSVVGGAREVLIGGASQGEGNRIAGGDNAIIVADEATANVTIHGNVIGLAVDGVTLLPSGMGVAGVGATALAVGGREPGAGNTIVAVDGPAILLDGLSRADVRGNRIGLRPDDVPVGNGVGVELRGGAVDNLVQENVFAASRDGDIRVLGDDTVRNRLTRNAFLGSPGLPIDLGGDGPTPNDPDDMDIGPNGLLNAPLIDRYDHDGVVATAAGSAPPHHRVEVYRLSSPRLPPATPHAGGAGGGVEFLATARVNRDGRWEASFAIPPGQILTALTVASSGDTSEFAVNVVPPPPELLNAGLTAAAWFGPETPVADALASVGTRLEVVFRYDAASQAWRTYRPALPALSNLDTLHPGDAVWVGLFPGLQLLWVQPPSEPAPRAVALSPGLNFVTWTGPPLEIDAALGSIAPATDTVFRWDRAARRFDLVYPTLPFAQAPATLQPHDILWLRLRPGPVQTWSQPAP